MRTNKELEEIIRKREETIRDIVNMNTYSLSELKEERQRKFKKFNNEECWIYSTEEDNHLETLTCPVVISAVDLQELINIKNEFFRIHKIDVDDLEEINDDLLNELESLQSHLEDVRSSVGILALAISTEFGTNYKESAIGKKLCNLQDIFDERFINENSW